MTEYLTFINAWWVYYISFLSKRKKERRISGTYYHKQIINNTSIQRKINKFERKYCRHSLVLETHSNSFFWMLNQAYYREDKLYYQNRCFSTWSIWIYHPTVLGSKRWQKPFSFIYCARNAWVILNRLWITTENTGSADINQ